MDVGKLDSASIPTAEARVASMATTAAVARSVEGKVALVAGATGLVGRELVRALLLPSSAWKLVYGVARRPPDDDDDHERYRFLTCDLLDRGETMEKLSPLAEKVTDVFWVTWASQFPLDTRECCDQNRAMLSNALDALLLPVPSPALAHLALQTGTMHYVSIKQAAAAGCHVYYEEESPRVGEEDHNFYYALEDLVKERLGGGGRRIASWSVHRPGLLLGSSRRSHFNLMGSLCVYASICKHLGLPFRFHGLRRCWVEPYMDASDARVVANQNLWWASVVSSSTSSSLPSTPSSSLYCQAFNAVNGTAFTWKEVWPALAAKFGLSLQADDDDELVSEETSYSRLMEDKGAAWEEIVAKDSLRPSQMDDLANWAFLDMVFRFPAKILVSSGKAHRLGFTTSYAALESLLYWVDRMREERLIPSY
ncbi:(S)-8-oxocitronellyl enol synthase CYC2 [Elaeis guineensis]|uniref:Iridoid synthase CYC2 n=1 Tax=Elaeis guineensis var. tenera TaxID=51953 RepID=A0A6I9QPR2_ELAGV|nr:iridoid synthase CYC2 [Elaeis guineensis]